MPAGGNFSSCSGWGGSDACEQPTQPVATVGLCLADGTPIATTITRDCAGTVTSEGWIDLATGAWSVGPPPAGVVACGDSRSITTNGTFCDIDPDTGDVLGLVLVEYQYAADGSIASVRLVDAVTGDTYTPQGEVTTCPAGVEAPEQDIVQLCDTAADGTVTAFVRDYRHDETGAVTGYQDYALDGEAYTPAGTVGRCTDTDERMDVESYPLCVIDNASGTVLQHIRREVLYDADGAQVGERFVDAVTGGPVAVPGGAHLGVCPDVEPCRDTSTLLLCDLPGDGEPTAAVTDTDPTGVFPGTGQEPVTGGAAALWSGGVLAIPADTAPPSDGTSQLVRTVAATVQAERPACDTGMATITASVRVERTGPDAGCIGTGSFRLIGGTGAQIAAAGISPSSIPVGTVQMLTITGQVPAAEVAAGDVRLFGLFETYHLAPVACPGGSAPDGARTGGWNLDQFTVEVAYDQAGCGEQVFASVVTDCETGEVQSVTYTLPDGTPYTPVGSIGQCTPATSPAGQECQHCQTLTLCDMQPDDTPGSAEESPWTVVDVVPDPDSPEGRGYLFRMSPAHEPDLVGTVRVTSGTTANTTCTPQPPFNLGFHNTNDLTFELDAVAQQMSYLRVDLEDFDTFEPVTIHSGSPEPTRLGGTAEWNDAHTQIVPTESNGTGYLYWDNPPATFGYRIWNTGGGSSCSGLNFAGVTLLPPPATGTPVPFLRTVCRDCTGQVISIMDTGLDGETPYTPTGDIQACPAGGANPVNPEPCRDVATTLLCDVSAVETITVLDTGGVEDDDGWVITSYSDGGCTELNAPDGPVPGPAVWSSGGHLSVRADRTLGGNCVPWTGYDSAPVRWVLTKTFTVAEDGMAVVTADSLTADGAARVRVNGQDVGLYAQWNQPTVGGSSQIPVTAGLNVMEIEVRDVGGPTWLRGRLNVVTRRTTQFLRRQVTDCETGAVISVTDTTLDGEPYEVTGEVGQCQTVSQCCEQATPELRVDVESDVMCIRDAGGEITGQVVVERVYDDQSGDRVVQRLTDPTTGDEVTLPDGAELVLCQEPPCPTAFSTECVGAVTRTEAAYDNTSLIGGVPGQCGSVQGPADPPNTGANFGCAGGPYTITSWIVNGEEAIAEGGGRTFQGGPCGPGTAGNPGMHLNWAQALTNLDPTGASWVVDNQPGCAWYVRSEGGSDNVYGPMTITGNGAGVTDGTWVLGAAQSCEETQYTRVYSQDCDGSVSVSWLDAQGVETDAPEGDLVPCGTGCGSGGGAGLDVELVALCDVQEDGTAVPFLRHITYGSAGQVSVVIDTGLDGFAPYTPTGTVSRCQDDREPGVDIETLRMCVIDNATGNPLQEILAELRYDTETGERIGVTYVDPLTWGPVAIPGGAHFGLCPEQGPAPDVELLSLCDVQDDGTSTAFLRHLVYQAEATAPTVLDTLLDGVTPYTPAGEVGTCAPEEECPSRNTLSACRWDDTDGDGIADTEYVELLAVDCDGVLTSVGTYLPDLSAPYTPTSPVDGSTADPGPEPVVNVQPHRRQLEPDGSWDADSVAGLRSVTFTAHDGTGTITTTDGTSTLHQGESVTWSIDKDVDAALVGPLTVSADTGTVTVTWTTTA